MDARLLALSVPLLAAAGSALVRGSGVRTGISAVPTPIDVQLLQIEGRDAEGHLFDWSFTLWCGDKMILVAEFPHSGGPNGVNVASGVAGILQHPALRPRQRQGLFVMDGWQHEDAGLIKTVTNRWGQKEQRRGDSWRFRIERPPVDFLERAKRRLHELEAEERVRLVILPERKEGSPVRTTLAKPKGTIYAWWKPGFMVATGAPGRWGSGPFWGGFYNPKNRDITRGVFFEDGVKGNFDPLSILRPGDVDRTGESSEQSVFFFVSPEHGRLLLDLSDPRVKEAASGRSPRWNAWVGVTLEAISELIEIKSSADGSAVRTALVKPKQFLANLRFTRTTSEDFDAAVEKAARVDIKESMVRRNRGPWLVGVLADEVAAAGLPEGASIAFLPQIHPFSPKWTDLHAVYARLELPGFTRSISDLLTLERLWGTPAAVDGTFEMGEWSIDLPKEPLIRLSKGKALGSKSGPSPVAEIAGGVALLAIPTPLFDLPGLAMVANGVRRLGSHVRTTLVEPSSRAVLPLPEGYFWGDERELEWAEQASTDQVGIHVTLRSSTIGDVAMEWPYRSDFIGVFESFLSRARELVSRPFPAEFGGRRRRFPWKDGSRLKVWWFGVSTQGGYGFLWILEDTKQARAAIGQTLGREIGTLTYSNLRRPGGPPLASFFRSSGSPVRTGLPKPKGLMIPANTRVQVRNRDGNEIWTGEVLASEAVIDSRIDDIPRYSGLPRESLESGQTIYYVKRRDGSSWVHEHRIKKAWIDGKWVANPSFLDVTGSPVRTKLPRFKPPWRFQFDGNLQWGGLYDRSKRKVVMAVSPETGRQVDYDILRFLREASEDSGKTFDLSAKGSIVPFSIREDDGAVIVPKYGGLCEADREDWRSTIGWSLTFAREPE